MLLHLICGTSYALWFCISAASLLPREVVTGKNVREWIQSLSQEEEGFTVGQIQLFKRIELRLDGRVCL